MNFRVLFKMFFVFFNVFLFLRKNGRGSVPFFFPEFGSGC